MAINAAFFSIDCEKAGFLIKNKGIWFLTPEGERRTVRAAAGGMSYLLARNTQVIDDYPSAKLRTGVEQLTTLSLPAVEGSHR